MNREANLAATLHHVPIFRDIPHDDCARLASAVELLEFAPGDLIMREGDCSRHLWVVLDGSCEVVRLPESHEKNQAPVVLAALEPYSQFGEMSFFRAAPHSASVRARTAVRLFRISRADYDRLVEQGSHAAHKLALNAVESLADRLERMDQWVEDLLRSGACAAPPVGEWETFRQRLFTAWNL